MCPAEGMGRPAEGRQCGLSGREGGGQRKRDSRGELLALCCLPEVYHHAYAVQYPKENRNTTIPFVYLSQEAYEGSASAYELVWLRTGTDREKPKQDRINRSPPFPPALPAGSPPGSRAPTRPPRSEVHQGGISQEHRNQRRKYALFSPTQTLRGFMSQGEERNM